MILNGRRRCAHRVFLHLARRGALRGGGRPHSVAHDDVLRLGLVVLVVQCSQVAFGLDGLVFVNIA